MSMITFHVLAQTVAVLEHSRAFIALAADCIRVDVHVTIQCYLLSVLLAALRADQSSTQTFQFGRSVGKLATVR